MSYKDKVIASNPPSGNDFNDGDTWTDNKTGVTFKLFKYDGGAKEWWPTKWLEHKKATEEKETLQVDDNPQGGF